MRQKIGIVDYGYAGNIFNIAKVLSTVEPSVQVVLIDKSSVLKKLDKIIFPGVGAYKDAMQGIGRLKAHLEPLFDKKPILGICLGMQIFSEKGYEFGETEGLKVLNGEVMRLPVKCRIPHLGWSSVEPIRQSRILNGVTSQDKFYFMHSYELLNYTEVVGLSEYCGHRFVSAVEKGNVFGVQFHPEKSRESGLKIMRNFLQV